MKKFWKNWSVPAVLLLLIILGLGIIAPSLGFYWDDWPSLLIYKLQGLSGFRQFFSTDRPTTFISYEVLMPILGVNPMNWQIFTLLMRWLTAVLLWWFLSGLFPGDNDIPIAAALLFAVFPIFHQQPIALTYHQLWLEYAFYMLSLAGMVEAVRRSRQYWFWTAAAICGLVLNFSISEYFLGVELLRPAILWVVLFQGSDYRVNRKRLAAIVKQWLPYLATLLIYLAWRFIFLKLPGPDRNSLVLLTDFISAPLPTLLKLAQMAAQDICYILVTNWYSVLQPGLFDLGNRFNVISLGLSLVITVATITYLIINGRLENWVSDLHLTYSKIALTLGLLLTAISPLPAWVTGRQVTIGAWSDRLAVPAMFGASMVLSGLIFWLVRRRIQAVVLICLMTGLAAGADIRIANDYRWASVQQNRFFWQLSWRAPGLMSGTAVLADAEILPKTGLYSTASGINVIYAQKGVSSQLPFWFFSISREFPHRLAELVANVPLEASFRQFTFQGSSQNSLIVYYNPSESDCMRIVTPADNGDPALSPVVTQVLSISNLSRIQANPSQKNKPDRDIFGAEPAHGWCYYFQKADLARQEGDWGTVVKLGDEAKSRGYTMDNSQSNTPQEWIVFIEGYAHQGRWQEAQTITRAALAREPKMRQRLCADWQSLAKDISGAGQQAETIFSELSCQPK